MPELGIVSGFSLQIHGKLGVFQPFTMKRGEKQYARSTSELLTEHQWAIAIRKQTAKQQQKAVSVILLARVSANGGLPVRAQISPGDISNNDSHVEAMTEV